MILGSAIILIVFVPVVLGLTYFIARFLFSPLRRRWPSSEGEMPRTNFPITDILVLLFQLAITGLVVFQTGEDLSPANRMAIMIALWFVLIWSWWLGVRWLSRAKVENPVKRGVLLAAPIPLGMGALLWTMLLAHAGQSMFFRFVVTRTPEEMQYWHEVFPSAALVSAGAWLLFVVLLCRNASRWAAADSSAEETDKPKERRGGYRWGLIAALVLLVLQTVAVSFIWVSSAPSYEPRTAFLWSRSAKTYELATFSFEHGLRDDPFSIARNDWDLLYGNAPQQDIFDVNTIVDDRSAIRDLGKKTWSDISRVPILPPLPKPSGGVGPSLPAIDGHMYLVRTKDGNSDLHALFRVEKITPGTSCRISWRRVKPDELFEEEASKAGKK